MEPILFSNHVTILASACSQIELCSVVLQQYSCIYLYMCVYIFLVLCSDECLLQRGERGVVTKPKTHCGRHLFLNPRCFRGRRPRPPAAVYLHEVLYRHFLTYTVIYCVCLMLSLSTLTLNDPWSLCPPA